MVAGVVVVVDDLVPIVSHLSYYPSYPSPHYYTLTSSIAAGPIERSLCDHCGKALSSLPEATLLTPAKPTLALVRL